jgi:hypothetical protein
MKALEFLTKLKHSRDYDGNLEHSLALAISELEELKAKDDEIRRLNNLYADTIKDLGDALIEIERMKEKTQILEVLVDNTKDIIESQTRMCRTKARSIVAMLFWEWHSSIKFDFKTRKLDKHTKAEIIFKQAYRMLKDDK